MDKQMLRQKIKDLAKLDGVELTKDMLFELEQVFRAGRDAAMPGWCFEQLPMKTLRDRVYRLGAQYTRMLLRSIFLEDGVRKSGVAKGGKR